MSEDGPGRLFIAGTPIEGVVRLYGQIWREEYIATGFLYVGKSVEVRGSVKEAFAE